MQKSFKQVKKLLANKGLTNYRISQETGISQSTLSDLKRNPERINRMPVENAIKLHNLFLKEMEEMENIKQIITGIENGKVEVHNEADYEDVNGVEYIAHFVNGHEELEVFFEKRVDANEVDPNELDDVFNYDKVAAYRVGAGNIEWV